MALSGEGDSDYDVDRSFVLLAALTERRDRDVVEITQRLQGLAQDLTGCANCAEMRVECVEAALKDLCERMQKVTDILNDIFGPLE